MISRPRSAPVFAPLSWLQWCAALLLVLAAWAVRLSPFPYFASGYEPATVGAKVLRSDEAGFASSEKSVRLDQRAVAPSAKPKRSAPSKRFHEPSCARLASWGGSASAERIDSVSANVREARHVTPIRKRIPRLGTDEPPWSV